MKETPLLLKAEMVIPAIADLKTQTRRLNGLDVINGHPDRWHIVQTGHHNCAFAVEFRCSGLDLTILCPYGETGDRLWARETHKFIETKDGITLIYRADNACHGVQDNAGVLMKKDLGKWRPSIFMFRWASRLTLEIINVRAQRLQDISADDARAEGIIPHCDGGCSPQCNACNEIDIDTYRRLWDSINGKKHPWTSNPWVWVVTFKRITA